MRYFFSRYIIIEDLLVELDGLDLSEQQKNHLSKLMDSSLHHAVLDEILSNLEDEDKKIFLKLLHEDPENETLMEFLKSKIDDIEDKIKGVSEQLAKEMHKDVKEAKKIR